MAAVAVAAGLGAAILLVTRVRRPVDGKGQP
jgi:hypothetical protein